MTQGGRHGDQGLEIGRKTMQPIYDHIALAKQNDQPFMIWYAPMMPHDPHTPPDRLLDRYRDKTPSVHIARYWAMVEWFDETIGDLLQHLDQQGMARDTLIMYVADNGWIQNPEQPRYGPKSKQSPYDGGLRTPIMLRMPGKIAPGFSDDLAQSIDLFPTLASVLQMPPPQSPVAWPGINLLDERARADRTTLYGNCFTHNAVDLDDPSKNVRWRWMIDGQHKLIVPDSKNEANGVVELYDLAHDVREETNLAQRDPSRVESLRQKMDAWWKP
jgi:uncharacterized sulfatase